ncbi:hypothetical protein J7L05_03955, partial [bacterium]|nr:hypothetical protein [bacterium]
MNKKQFISIRNVTSFVCLFFLLNLFYGCNNKLNNAGLKSVTKDTKTNKCQVVFKNNEYYPLNAGILSDIRNGSSNFSGLYMRYSTFTPVPNHQIFNISYGNFYGNFIFSDIGEFEAYLRQNFDNPPVARSLEHTFTYSEVDSILAYISSP